MSFVPTATKLWRRLSPEERLAAARTFWESPPEEVAGSALGAIMKIRHLRPQVARSLDVDARARYLGVLLDPGETVAAALLVALHLGARRPMLGVFLDAVGLPHEDGLLKDEADQAPALSVEAGRRGLEALRKTFTPAEIETYFNTLWLQDPGRWEALRASADWLAAP